MVGVSDFICETTGRLALSTKQIAAQLELPEASRLHATDAHRIIYPGKNHNAWWDLNQLIDQVKDAVDIFEYLKSCDLAVGLFFCS
jgi:hypothetical protein